MGFGLALIGKFKIWVYAAGVALVAIVGAYFRGKSDEAGDEHERELNEYVATRKRVDDADIDNADVAREFLRDRRGK
tara:strand:- start:3608 stop:3838 length:231 start_codon:yes stop_codon:yes gene_type:complete